MATATRASASPDVEIREVEIAPRSFSVAQYSSLSSNDPNMNQPFYFELINTRSHFLEIPVTSFRTTYNSQLGALAVDHTGKLFTHRGEDVGEHET